MICLNQKINLKYMKTFKLNDSTKDQKILNIFLKRYIGEN